MFRLWQLIVAAASAWYLVEAVGAGLPYFVALPIALLAMSVLAADHDPGAQYACRDNAFRPKRRI